MATLSEFMNRYTNKFQSTKKTGHDGAMCARAFIKEIAKHKANYAEVYKFLEDAKEFSEYIMVELAHNAKHELIERNEEIVFRLEDE